MQTNSSAVLGIGALVLLALVVTQGIAIVDAGNVGVVTRFGSVQEQALQPGLHFKVPIMTKVIHLDTRVQKVEEEASASSKDLQIVTSKIALNYRVDPTQASTIYSQLGLQYPMTIVQPALQESIKATSAKYTAEELITKRAEVAQEMEDDLVARLENKNIQPTDLSIIDFQFSPEFNEAIESKQVAQQAALRAQNELERVRIEAQQAQAEAEGVANAELERARAEAEAQQMLRETINADLLQLRAIEKWDGVLPVYSGGDAPLPFLAVPRTQAVQ